MRIDFHAHIIPHADHGSSSVESAIKQLEEAKKAEVDYIVATRVDSDKTVSFTKE